MTRMMAVDDKPVTREGIVRTVDQESLDVQTVGTARNGRDGMAKVLTEKPDIVIMDIRVPVVDGIRFAKELKEKLPKVEVMFLTGYSEFEHTREVIRLRTADYLLKPTNTEGLAKLVRKLADRVRRENATIISRIQKTVLLKENPPMMRNCCMKHYFQGEVGETTPTEQAGALGTDFSGQKHQITIFCINYYYQLIVSGERGVGPLKYAMPSTTGEVPGVCGSAIIRDKGEVKVMVILGTDQETEKITRRYREVQFCIREYYGVFISAGIGRKVEAIQDFKISYRSTSEVVEERVKRGSGQTIAREGDPRGGSEHARLSLTPEEEQETSNVMRLLDKNRVYGALEMVFQRYVMEQDLGRRGTEQFCIYLVLIAMRQLEHFSMSSEQALGKNYYYHNETPRCGAVQNLEM